VLAAVRAGDRVIDVGAQVGYSATLAARAAGTAGRVWAFEPAPNNYPVVAANALLLGQIDPDAATIIASDRALTERTGNARLYLSDRNPGDHSTAPPAWEAIETRVVPATTADALRWPTEGPALVDGPVGVLKVDVAGAELTVLRGAERLLTEDRPVVLVAARPSSASPNPVVALIEWLVACGYAGFRFAPPAAPDPHALIAAAARLLGPVAAFAAARQRPPSQSVLVVAHTGQAVS
jgi:FkbM family methyltransferase